ncbi:hypothetical protein VTN31DRAFT_2854 [Thermomyces dupontii]|uniref:uncharacterized protein n=1 Tax=Talaromyces thermophilus TaxID=28565 RepID=UPI0037444A4C
MAWQEIGHATTISNMLGPSAPQPCFYQYNYKTVREFVDFCQKLTRWGEAGVYGFLGHLNSGESAAILLQSITTEARQQLVFRQFDGLFPMPEWFQVGVPQSWAWTLLAPFISYCPANQTRLVWQNFPALRILNQPNPARTNGSEGFNETLEAGASTLNETAIPDDDKCFDEDDDSNDCPPAITQNRTIPLSWPGRVVNLTWENPGLPVGPNNSYITSSQAGEPAFVAWVTQLNVTYSPLTVLNSSNSSNSANASNSFTWSGSTVQPNVETFMGDPAVNGTIFIAITDTDLFVTPYNISLINPHVVAGPALYQAG